MYSFLKLYVFIFRNCAVKKALHFILALLIKNFLRKHNHYENK